ncbi:murein biosynthesis integral membrane protein MurJ [Alphaproteobacteria bacterium]|nr:murein biosynthesis integral membrane protein MurJ [Alphaproteobacteria bacterium]
MSRSNQQAAPDISPAKPNVLRAALSVGSATLISRITGLVRDIFVAAALGAGPISDIFVVAFRLPNLFRRLFAEGAFSAAFVPLYSEQLEKNGEADARNFASSVFAVLLLALVLFTAIAQIFMPYMVMAIAQGFTANSEQFDLAVYYTRIAFPYLLFMSLLAFYSALLNARGSFFAPAFAPVLLNIVLISALTIAFITDGIAIDYLIWGVAIAGAVQLAWAVIAAFRRGITIDLTLPRLTPDVRKLWWLAIPGILAAGIGQINLLVGTSIATAQAGAASWLYYADRLYQLPMGIVGVALGVALLPTMSRFISAGDLKGAGQSQSNAIVSGMALTIPAAVGLAVLAEPLVQIFFERGAFTPEDRLATAAAVRIFCLGLPAFILIKLLQPAFFARQDTRTPLIDGAIGVVVNIGLSLLLFDDYGHLAIAFATICAGYVTLALTIVRVLVLGYWRPELNLIWRLIAQILSALTMGFCVYLFVERLNPGTSLSLVGVTLLAVAIGACIYGICLWVLRGFTRADLTRLRRR